MCGVKSLYLLTHTLLHTFLSLADYSLCLVLIGADFRFISEPMSILVNKGETVRLVRFYDICLTGFVHAQLPLFDYSVCYVLIGAYFRFISEPMSMLVNEGETVRLPCIVDRITGFVLLWNQGDKVLTVANQVKIDEKQIV